MQEVDVTPEDTIKNKSTPNITVAKRRANARGARALYTKVRYDCG